MANIQDGVAFEPDTVAKMVLVVEAICEALKLTDKTARDAIAMRVIELARQGERDPEQMRQRLLRAIIN